MIYRLTITYTYFVSSPISQDPPSPHRSQTSFVVFVTGQISVQEKNYKYIPNLKFTIEISQIFTKFEFWVLQVISYFPGPTLPP